MGFVTFLAVWILSNRVYPMPWNFRRQSETRINE